MHGPSRVTYDTRGLLESLFRGLYVPIPRFFGGWWNGNVELEGVVGIVLRSQGKV